MRQLLLISIFSFSIVCLSVKAQPINTMTISQLSINFKNLNGQLRIEEAKQLAKGIRSYQDERKNNDFNIVNALTTKNEIEKLFGTPNLGANTQTWIYNLNSTNNLGKLKIFFRDNNIEVASFVIAETE